MIDMQRLYDDFTKNKDMTDIKEQLDYFNESFLRLSKNNWKLINTIIEHGYSIQIVPVDIPSGKTAIEIKITKGTSFYSMSEGKDINEAFIDLATRFATYYIDEKGGSKPNAGTTVYSKMNKETGIMEKISEDEYNFYREENKKKYNQKDMRKCFDAGYNLSKDYPKSPNPFEDFLKSISPKS